MNDLNRPNAREQLTANPLEQPGCDSPLDSYQLKRRRVDQLVAYYTEALNDYDDWSRNKHMHFGYCDSPGQLFKLEAMLNRMTVKVLDLVFSTHGAANRAGMSVVDLGCGLGASCRLGAGRYKNTMFHGVSIVESQINYARQLNAGLQTKLKHDIQYTCADYTALPFADNSFHGAFAIESSCYAQGKSKIDFLQEAYRILKPGSQLVVADGFLKNSATMPKALHYFHNKLCDAWAFESLADIDLFKQSMKYIGFKNIQIRDISLNVAPSFAYIPFVTLKFVLKEIFIKKRKFNNVSWGHVFAPLYGIILGLSRRRFSYYIVSGEK